MNETAEEWALINGYKIDGWLGNGDFGEAFITTCGKVVKVTRDKEEFVASCQIEQIKDDHLPEIYQTDFYNNSFIILMEYIDTENVEDLFDEFISKSGNFGIEALEYMDPEELDLSDETHVLFSDLQKGITAYQQQGVNPMDIHHNNIGKNSKGNYILFDQKDKVNDLTLECEKILENKEKQKIINKINNHKIEINFQIQEIEFENSNFNNELKKIYEKMVEKINEKHSNVYTINNKKSYPELDFPNALNVNIYLTTNSELLLNFNPHTSENILGLHTITTGDGVLGESYFMDEHAVLIAIDEKNFHDLRNLSYFSDAIFMENYLNTLTHELNHVLEFIERSGGLTPREIDNLFETDEFDYNIFDCSTGYNFLPLFDQIEQLDQDEIISIMEERVELKGQKMIQSLQLENEFKDFPTRINKKENKKTLKL